MGLKNQCIFIFSSWLIWNFGWCHLGIFDFTVKYVYTFRYLCTFCGSSEHRDNSKKKVYLGIFFLSEASEKIWISRVNSGSGSFFFSFLNCIFIFWNLIKIIQKIFQIEIKKAPQSCEIQKRGNSGKKWHCFCPNAKIKFFPSFAIWICTSRVVIGNRTGFWTSTDIRFKFWDVLINPMI